MGIKRATVFLNFMAVTLFFVGAMPSLAMGYCLNKTIVKLECGNGLSNLEFSAYASRYVASQNPNGSNCGMIGTQFTYLYESTVPDINSKYFFDAYNQESQIVTGNTPSDDLTLSDANIVTYTRSLTEKISSDYSSHLAIDAGTNHFSLVTKLGKDDNALLSVTINNMLFYTKRVTCNSSTQ